MSPTVNQLIATSAQETLGGALKRRVATLFARARQDQAYRLTCAEIAALSPTLRRDVGMHDKAIGPNRPSIEVDASVMTTLMSLR